MIIVDVMRRLLVALIVRPLVRLGGWKRESAAREREA